MPWHKRAQAFRVEPWHQRPDHHRQRHGRQHDGAGQKRADKSPEQIVELSDTRCVDDRAKACFAIAQNHVRDERHNSELREDRHDGDGLRDRARAVDIGVAARTDLNGINRDRQKGQQKKDDERDPEHGALKLIAQLKRRDFAEHGFHSAQAARAAARVEKYRSSSPPSTAEKSGPGCKSAKT